MSLHALTDKQQKILLTVAGYFPEGKYKYPLDIDQIVGASLNSVGLNRSRFSDLQVPAPLVCIL